MTDSEESFRGVAPTTTQVAELVQELGQAASRVRNGWTWVMRDVRPPVSSSTKHRDCYDGVYTAACPACGQDCAWNAFDGESLCNCGGRT